MKWNTGCLITCVFVCVFGYLSAQAPTDAEIRNVTSQIWDADDARVVGDDVQYNVNGPVFFTYVNESCFVGTYASMIDMYDNYIADVGIPEFCGQSCRDEEDKFLDEVLATRPMQIAHQWLSSKGLAGATVDQFKAELLQYWFQLYTRSGGALGSSGFEHVFVGEMKDNAVSGFHNWVTMYFEEKIEHFKLSNFQAMCQPEIPKIGFTWMGYSKSISSLFLRSSPELQLALYTVCFRARLGPSCPVRLAGLDTLLTTWDMTGVTPLTIGSAWPNC